jgi:multiple RNA-binding domain-containing protein 1
MGWLLAEKRYIEVTEAEPEQNLLHKLHATEPQAPPKKQYPAPLRENDEDMGESGRLFVRNLAYNCTEDDLRAAFEVQG